MTTVSPLQSRFQLLELPTSLPGKCVGCGAIDRPVVDLGLDLFDFGTIYFCETCITEMAGIFGMVAGQEMARQSAKAAQSLEAQLDNLNLVAITRELFNALIGFVNSVPPLISDTICASDLVFDETVGEDEGIFGEEVDDATEADSTTPVGEGPASVPADSGNGFSL